MQITNAVRKLVYSLSEVKMRRETGLFKVEGTKGVLDTMPHFEVDMLLCTQKWLDAHSVDVSSDRIGVATRADMERMSSLKTAPDVIAVLRIPQRDVNQVFKADGLMLALDCVQDPGNLGTIIRTADWFGVRCILASYDTADVWNPKVVQATMGSLARVKVYYCDLKAVLVQLKSNGKAIYGTFLGGENIYTVNLDQSGVVVMGNEGKGVSAAVAEIVNNRLTIPPYPAGTPTAESLNVAIATAITLSQFRNNG